MSVSRSVRCLVRQSRPSGSSPIATSRRCFHQTIRQEASKNLSRPDQQGATTSSKIPDYAIINPDRAVHESRRNVKEEEVPATEEAAAQYFPAYTEEEMQFLRRKYTPKQMAAIEAGEAAIDKMDLLKQGVVRTDYMKVKYMDDFRNLHPTLDRKKLAPESNVDLTMRLKTDEEMDEDMINFWTKMAQQKGQEEAPDVEIDFTKFLENYRFTVGRAESELNPPDYNAPELKKLTDPIIKRTAVKEDDEGIVKTMQEEYTRLSQATGLSREYLEKLQRRTLVETFVSNQTRMGKIRSYRYFVAVGNGNGLLGLGMGKAKDVQSAIWQAFSTAVRNMRPVPRYERRTIYGDVTAKVGATVVNLYNRPPGFGVRCQEKIWEMCRCAGISDLSARVQRARNPMNTVKATFEALTNLQRLPEDVARARGKKMVDVRKVYYAGLTQ